MAEIIGITDIGTKLYWKKPASGEGEGEVPAAWEEVVAIIAAPATGSAPNLLEATVLSSTTTQNLKGRLTLPDMEFGFNYTEANYKKAQAVATGEVEEFAILFGDESGFKITGEATTWTESIGRNSVVEGRLHIAAQKVEFKDASEMDTLLGLSGEGT